MLQSVSRQILEQHARLGMHDQVFHIVGEDFVHARGAENKAAANRHGASGQACAGAAGRHGDFVSSAYFHDRGDFLSALRLANGLGGKLAIDRHLVVSVVGGNAIPHKEAFFAHNGFQLSGNLGCNFMISCHLIYPPS